MASGQAVRQFMGFAHALVDHAVAQAAHRKPAISAVARTMAA